MKNIGDIVYIKDLNWYNKNKDNRGYITSLKNYYFTKDMSNYCGKKATIVYLSHPSSKQGYKIDLDNGNWYWTEDMFEDIKDRRKNKLIKIFTYESETNNKNCS